MSPKRGRLALLRGEEEEEGGVGGKGRREGLWFSRDRLRRSAVETGRFYLLAAFFVLWRLLAPLTSFFVLAVLAVLAVLCPASFCYSFYLSLECQCVLL